jgi:pheromone shutdown protein TraB
MVNLSIVAAVFLPDNLATQVMDYHGSMSKAFERFAVRPSSGLAEPRDNFMASKIWQLVVLVW